jgi:hypothetical protein
VTSPYDRGMTTSTSSRLASLSVHPARIAHLGLNNRSLSASLLNLKDDLDSEDDNDTNHKVKDNSRRELDDISVDSSFDEGNEGEKTVTEVTPQGSTQIDKHTTEETEQIDDNVEEGNKTPAPGPQALPLASEMKRTEDEASSKSKEAVPSPSDTTLTTTSVKAVPISPPPSYEHATSSTGIPQLPAAPVRAEPLDVGRGRRIPSPQPVTNASPPLSAKAQGKRPVIATEQAVRSIAPNVLERMPSSSSERSLFRAFQSQGRGSRTPDLEPQENDPDTFSLDISDPPSPQSRSNSISFPDPRDRKKGRSKPGGYIKIVDRSGGQWRDTRGEEDDQVEVDGDELFERIFKNEGLQGIAVAEGDAMGDSVATIRPQTPTLTDKRLDLNCTRSSSRTSPTLLRTGSNQSPLRMDGSGNPVAEPFARDVVITGWKIVGGETKLQQDRGNGKSLQELEKKYVEVERGKIGAFVGELSIVSKFPNS